MEQILGGPRGPVQEAVDRLCDIAGAPAGQLPTAELRTLYGAGAPTNGVTGLGAAGRLSSYADQTNGELYLNSGTKTNPVWYRPRMVINVQQKGVVADGVVDNYSLLRDLVAYAVSLGQSHAGDGITSLSRPCLYFPAGRYKITDYITPDTANALQWMDVIGDNAIFILSAGVTAFGGVGGHVNFGGLQFRGGACGISVKTNNVDMSLINVMRCKFYNQTEVCVKTDNNSASVHFRVEGNLFYQPTNVYGQVCIAGPLDCWSFKDNWVTYGHDTLHPIVNNGQELTFEKNHLVPRTPFADSGLGWVRNNQGSVAVIDNRAGGEQGGATLVDNYAALDSTYPISNIAAVICRDNETYNAAGPMVRFFEMPNQFVYNNNRGHIDTVPFYFDAAIPAASFKAFQTVGMVEIRGNQHPGGVDFFNNAQGEAANTAQGLGEMSFLAAAARGGSIVPPTLERIPAANIRALGNFNTSLVGAGWAAVSGAATTTTPTSEYGSAYVRYTAGADGQGRTREHLRFLDPAVLTGNKIYTLVLWLNAPVIVQPFISVLINIGGTYHTVRLRNDGRRVFCIPFVYMNATGSPDTTLDLMQVIIAGLLNTEQVDLERTMLLDGFVTYNSEVVQTKGTAAPSAYTPAGTDSLGFQRGDICWSTNVVNGATLGFVCTVAGNPGTWKPMSPLVFSGVSAADDVTAVASNNAFVAFAQTYPISAGALRAGTVLRARAVVRVTDASGADTLTVEMRIGGTSLIATTAVDPGATTDHHVLDFEFVARAAPAGAASCTGSGEWKTNTGGTIVQGTALLQPTNFNTAGALTLDVRAKWSSNTASTAARLEMLDVVML